LYEFPDVSATLIIVCGGTAEGPSEGPAEGDADGAMEGTVEAASETRGFVKTVAPPVMTAFPLRDKFSITIPPPEMTVFPPEIITWPGIVGASEGDAEGMAGRDADGATEGNRTEGTAEGLVGPGVKLSCAQTAGAKTARKKPVTAA
jgi:hypothetical protein